jgi:hypothetical protein
MTSNSWKNPVNGDWTDAADWTTGSVPGAGDAVTIAALGTYTVTLYTLGQAASLTLDDSGLLFYDAGTLAVSGTLALQAGTLDLAYGSLQGGTLALDGGLLQSSGGTLTALAVQGALNLSPTNSLLYVQSGLTLTGAGGSGTGSVALTGYDAALDFIGSQMLNSASISLGNTLGGVATLGIAHAFGATAGATLTLGPSLWLRQTGGQGALSIGNGLGGALDDELLNHGTITVSGGTLTVSGPGTLVNQGTIGISGGAVFDIASPGFSNVGTMSVSDSTLDFGGTFTTSLFSQLGALALSQATLEIGGEDINAGATLSVSSFIPLVLAGTITSGTVIDSGGGLTFGPGTGVLDGVTYQGTLAVTGTNGAVTLIDNTVLATGAATVTGSGAALLLEGLDTLGNATIQLGSNTGTAELGTTDPWVAGSATTATLASTLLVQQSGLNAAVNANAQTPIQGDGLADTLINQGSITGAVAGGTLSIGGYGTFINQGNIAISNSDTLLLEALSFSNTGTITISPGATAILGGPPNPWGGAPAWSNTGSIAVNGGTLQLAGIERTAQLGKITSSGGTISLTGTLANAGTTLTLGSGGVLPALSLTGTIQGGTISDPASLLSFGGGGIAMLQAVSYSGTLGLLQNGAYVRIYQGIALTGTANVTGAGSTLAFQGTETFNNAAVDLGATGGATLDVLHDYSVQGGSTLTLGSALFITQAGANAAIGLAADLAGDAIINKGTVTGGTYGGTLSLGSQSFTNQGTIAISNGDTLALNAAAFSNTGNMSITNASLDIADSLTIAQLGRLALTNAAISIAGTLNNAGNTLTVGTGSQWGQVTLTGTIHGGVVLDDGLGLATFGNATLDAVSYRGTLNLSRPFQDLDFADTVHFNDPTGTLTGTVFLTGAADRMVATTSETLPDVNFYIGSNTVSYYGQRIPAPELDAGLGTALTIGASTTVRTAGTYSTLGDATLGKWTDSITNDGTILAATNGCSLTLGSTFFVNAASLLINTGSSVFAGDVGFDNTGVIAITAGANLEMTLYDYYAAPNAGPAQFTNSGTIRILGGAFAELTGNGTFPAVAVANLSGGLIQGLGTILAPILNNGTIESKYGPVLQVLQGVTGTGTMLIDQGVILELNNQVAASQTVSYTGTAGILKLDMPLSFGAAVTGFGGSDILDLAATTLTAVGISSGTLVATTSKGNFFLNSAPLGGELSAGGDGHSGMDISYLPQSQGSGVAVIALTQPAMMFWASPVGDEFQGPTWELNGSWIGDWTTADSLDFTDMNGSKASASWAQGSGQGTLTVTDGTKTGHILLNGSFNANWFHAGADGHGGALITYHS